MVENGCVSLEMCGAQLRIEVEPTARTAPRSLALAERTCLVSASGISRPSLGVIVKLIFNSFAVRSVMFTIIMAAMRAKHSRLVKIRT